MNKKLTKEWDKHIDSGKVKVMIDNDGWWFAWKEGCEPKGFDPEEGEARFSGGMRANRDLLEHMLQRAGIEMEGV